MHRISAVLGAWSAAVLLSAQTATLRRDAGPEDPKLRAEAVRLLDRANRVSTPAVWPPNEMRLRFRVPDPAPGDPNEGEYVSSFGGPGLRRQEWRYGNFRPIQSRNGQRVSIEQNTVPKPAILELIPKLTPVFLVRFDQQDIIRAIVAGSEGSRCIQFDTVSGDRQQANEICVDTEHGWLNSIRLGDERTVNSKYFAFAGVFLPGHIEHWTGNTELIEIDESVEERPEYPPDFFSVPETATGFICQDFRRAYAVNTPQPPVQQSSSDVQDVSLTGTIGADGHVHDLKAVSPAHPDLNEEAIRLVSAWTFTPATCGGQPAWWATVFVIHFKGR